MSDEAQDGPPKHGLPSIVPRSPEEGLESALDALRPSLPPPGEQQAPPVPAVALLPDDGAEPTQAAAPEPPEPGVSPSSRPGLLSTVLSRPPTPHDPGARTAHSSIPRRAKAELKTPLLDPSTSGDRERAGLLEHLAQQSEGSPRARLLTAAAEQWQRLGEAPHAASLYEYAQQSDPRDLIVLRELRRRALCDRDLDRAHELLERETQLPLSQEEHALAWLLLAELQRASRVDASAAEGSAERAFDAHPSATAGLLLLELRSSSGRAGDAAETAVAVARTFAGGEIGPALLLEAGRAFEKAGDLSRAQTLFEQAQAASPALPDAALCWHRSAVARSDLPAALSALQRLGPALDPAGVDDDLLRTAARLLETTREHAADALRVLTEADSYPSLRLRAQLAERLGHRPAQRAALEACKQRAAGSERALCLLGLAELDAADGNLAAAARALREASAAEPRLGLTRVMQATLARVSGDAASFSSESEGAALDETLDDAARVASDTSATERELALLTKARAESATATMIALDAAFELGRVEEAAQALVHESEHGPTTQRLGALLALRELRVPKNADSTPPRVAVDAAPHGAALMAVHRLHQAAPEELGNRLLDLASQLRGAAAASFATLAGDCLASQGRAREAYERALTAAPDHAAACFSLERLLDQREDRQALIRLHGALERQTVDPLERAAREMRIATLSEPESPELAAERRRAAAGEDATDALLCDDAGNAASADVQLKLAELLEDAGHGATGRTATLCKLRAAARYEDAEEPARAAVLYRQVLDQSRGEDPHARAGLERALTQAGLLTLLFERLESVAKTSSSRAERRDALERLALLQTEAGDDRRALASFRALLELEPEHKGAARALQRRAMEQNDLEQLALSSGLLGARSQDARERGAELRLSGRALARLGQAPLRAEPQLGLAHALEAERAARASGDDERAARAVLALCESVSDPDAAAACAMLAADALERLSPRAALDALGPHAATAAGNSLLHERLGHLSHAAGDARGAAAAYERAARTSVGAARSARLFYRAALLWQDAIGEIAEARRMLEATVAIDVLHRDAFPRLHRLLANAGDLTALAALIEARLRAAGEPRHRAELHVERARLLVELEQRDAAKVALEQAFALDPERLDALRELARLHMATGSHREAAESLIRLARSLREPKALRDTFMTLGRIYTEQLPDLRRAEIAFARAVGLDPSSVAAIEQLMLVCRRKGDHDKALRAGERLFELARSDEEGDQRAIEIATVLEDMGERMRAERVLNQRREHRPTSAPVIIALGDLYARQYDQAALVVHLDRSIRTLRGAIEAEPSEAARWNALCDVLARRGRGGAAACVGAMAGSLGLADAHSSRLATAHRALGAKAFSSAQRDRLRPESLTDGGLELVRFVSRRADALLPARAAGQRVSSPTEALRRGLGTALECLALSDLVLLEREDRSCVPLRDKPLTLEVSRELVATCDADALAFLLLRALAMTELGLTGIASARPEALAAVLEPALTPSVPPGADAAKGPHEQALGGRGSRELQALVKAATSRGALDASKLLAASWLAATQLAFAALGNLGAALRALGACADTPAHASYGQGGPLEALERSSEAVELLRFALSDVFLDCHAEGQPNAESHPVG